MKAVPRQSASPPIHAIERRRTRRLRLQLPAAVFLRGEPRYVPFVVKDLSMTGAYLSSEVSMGPGERFVLSIRPPGTVSPIVAQARVVRIQGQGATSESEGAGMGVVFTAMSEESYAVLAGFWRAARHGSTTRAV